MATTLIDPDMTLAAVVTAHPELARELERRGLDYCCGGAHSLREACTTKGLDVNAAVAELAAASDAGAQVNDWATMDVSTLVDHIESTHHVFLWDEMPRLTELLAKIVTVHGHRHPELAEVAAVYGEVRADLEPHLRKEERVLFPMIRGGAGVELLDAPVGVMFRDHEHLGDLLATMRRLAGDYQVPEDGCPTYAATYRGLAEFEADTHLHIHKENNVLFPRVTGSTEA